MTNYSYEFLEQYYNDNRTKKLDNLPNFIISLLDNIDKLDLKNYLTTKEYLNEFDFYVQIFISNKLDNLSPCSLELPIYITEMFDIIKIRHNIVKTSNINSADIFKLIEYKLQFLNTIEIDDRYMLLWTTMISMFNTFNLCYFGCNLKNIQKYMCQLRYKYIYNEYQNVYRTSYGFKQIKNESKNKIKIGVVNDFLHKQHVMSKWYLPIFDSLDKNQYELIYISSKPEKEEKKYNISHNFDKIIHVLNCYNSLILNKNGDNTIKLLLNEKFDIMIYPSIGMSKLSQLSNIRLAPLQLMFPGHPITSGSKNIDYILLPNYFVKNESEKNLLQESVSEKIIYYNSIYLHTDVINIQQHSARSDLFMKNDIFYVTCFQNKWKITNYMKYLIENILNNTPNEIHIILQKNRNIDNNAITMILKNKYPNRILLIDDQTHQLYLNIIKMSDLILDSYPFNGSTTTLEALQLGKIVLGMDINNDSYTNVYIPSACLNLFYNILQINGLTYKTQKELINAINILYKNKNEKLRIEELINKNKFRFNTKMPDFNTLFLNLHNKHLPRIFNISCNKTGTTSLEHLFVKSFGFKLFNYMKLFYTNKTLVDEVFIKQDYTNLLKIIENSKTNFFSDTPFNSSNIYKILDKNYPNSKFILSIRNTESWINCLKKWLIKIKVELLNTPFYYCSKKWVQYAFPKTMNENWEIINEDLLAQLYEKHNNDIIDYFKGTDKLLIYKLEESSKSKIEKICDFIKIKNDNYCFPHKNSN